MFSAYFVSGKKTISFYSVLQPSLNGNLACIVLDQLEFPRP
ncbi:hypothetical protein GCWU000341_00327 [Oribacterium sp. oral taxon 078 str. F0262]|nr:hypothetical protein GCWU000341_00327 [Oribacterium sp. oral taxon 078 str. F0262]